jgi:hypothetical protein
MCAPTLSSGAAELPMLGLTVSTTRRHDVALIGIVLLAGGIAVLAGLPLRMHRLPIAAALWTTALLAFASARPRRGRR